MSTLLRRLAALEDTYIIVNDHTKDAAALEDNRKKAATALTQAEEYLEELDFTDSGTAMFSVDFTIDWTDAEDKLLMAAVKKLCTDRKLPNNPDIIDWDVIADALDDRDDDDCKARYCSKAANRVVTASTKVLSDCDTRLKSLQRNSESIRVQLATADVPTASNTAAAVNKSLDAAAMVDLLILESTYFI